MYVILCCVDLKPQKWWNRANTPKMGCQKRPIFFQEDAIITEEISNQRIKKGQTFRTKGMFSIHNLYYHGFKQFFLVQFSSFIFFRETNLCTLNFQEIVYVNPCTTRVCLYCMECARWCIYTYICFVYTATYIQYVHMYIYISCLLISSDAHCVCHLFGIFCVCFFFLINLFLYFLKFFY